MLLFKEVVPGVKLLKTPFCGSWGGVILIRGDKNILIDSGANTKTVDTVIIPALRSEGVRPNDIDWLLNTHCHGDHIGGHARLSELSNAKIAVWNGASDKILDPLSYNKLIRARFPEYSAPPSLGLRGVEPDILLDDGDIVAGRLRLIRTPGHDDDCVCWFDEATKTLISGDSLQGNGTSLQGIGFYQDLITYRDSLGRLLKLDIENIVAGHPYLPCGSLAVGREKSTAYLEKCLYLTEEYDILIREIKAHGVTEPAGIARRLIKQVSGHIPEYLFLALYTVCEHLKQEADA